MATTNTPAAEAAKKIEAFFTLPAAKTQVSLWVSEIATKGAPQFDGKIDGKTVAVWTRKAKKGNFLSINKRVKTGEKDAAGKPVYTTEQVGTANIVVTEKGIPKLAIKMADDKDVTIWASIRKTTPQALLDASGFDANMIESKRAAAAAAAAAKPAKPAKSTKPSV